MQSGSTVRQLWPAAEQLTFPLVGARGDSLTQHISRGPMVCSWESGSVEVEVEVHA